MGDSDFKLIELNRQFEAKMKRKKKATKRRSSKGPFKVGTVSGGFKKIKAGTGRSTWKKVGATARKRKRRR